MKNKKRHFIFTSGRSGSNYIANTLNLSPDCVNYGEVLGEWTLPYQFIGRFLCNEEGSEKYLNYIFSSRTFFRVAQVYSMYWHIKTKRDINFKRLSNVSSIGVKDFLVSLERRNGLNFLKENKDIKVIYLYRRNFLKRHISGLFLRKNRVAATYHKMEIEPITVNIDDMLRTLEIISNESTREKKYISSLCDHDVLEVEYESYFESQASISSWNKRIFEFLGVLPGKTVSSQKKILPNTLKEIVKNNDEIVAALKNTQYESFLY